MGIGGCGGVAVTIKKEGDIAIVKRCEGTVFETGYYLPVKTFIHLVLTYDGNNMSFYENGKIVNTQRKLVSFTNHQTLDIGYNGSQNSEFFSGEIEFVQIYRQAISQAVCDSLS